MSSHSFLPNDPGRKKYKQYYRVPVNKELLEGTVPVNKELLEGTVPVNKKLLEDAVPVNKELLTGTRSLSITSFQKIKNYCKIILTWGLLYSSSQSLHAWQSIPSLTCVVPASPAPPSPASSASPASSTPGSCSSRRN